MRAWRKLIALVLLVIFAPATIVAAMPLQLCLGDDGHQAIERLFASDHHQDGTHAERTSIAEPHLLGYVDATAMSDPTCRDLLLQTGGQASVRSATSLDDTNIKNCFPVTSLTYPQSDTPTAVCDSPGQGQPHQGAECDPQLAIRATTVLLN